MTYTWWRSYLPALLLLAGLILTTASYLPGLSGPWLVDDDLNLGMFSELTPQAASYTDIIFNNKSGPLGRPVAMASFSANHALGLFSTQALKATNLLLHLISGILLFLLLNRLFRLKAPASILISAPTLAAVISVWWLLLPLHISSVLYIVQRMTLLASLFSLATCLIYTVGRDELQSNRRAGGILIGASLLLSFPLAILAKESALVTLAWLTLIELFFFRKPSSWHIGIRPTLFTLILLTCSIGVMLTFIPSIRESYIGREFTLEERLLSQSRALWSYISDLFVPNGRHMGVFQDDFPVSHGLLSPWTTLIAVAGITGLLAISIQLAASRWWAVSFGILFYLSGHLLESSIVPLELYFEHRNYLPSIGLLVAVSSAITMLWPSHQRLLALGFFVYLGALSFSTLQRTHIWGDKTLLLETSALNHPHSLRAWTDYSENLLENRKPRLALEAALQAASLNPDFASISLMQMISIYCRINHAPPAELIERTASQLALNTNMASSFTTPLGIGLENILTNQKNGRCQQADFSPLANALPRIDQQLIQHYGSHRDGLWFLRLTLSEWLIETQQPQHALEILRDTWISGEKSTMPMIGLVLARTLTHENALEEAQQVLADLATVTHDAPEDFRKEMALLQQRASGSK